ncbi:MAG: hypothetical protein JSR17_12610 [Proteobacteria bacterium]|nr:hypothetical protein [Pseudomonadota bacterium]
MSLNQNISDIAMRIRAIAFAIQSGNEPLFSDVLTQDLNRYLPDLVNNTNARFEQEFNQQDNDLLDFATNKMTSAILRKALIKSTSAIEKDRFYRLICRSKNIEDRTALYLIKDNEELADYYDKLVFLFSFRCFYNEMRELPGFIVKEDEIPQRLQMVEYALLLNDKNLALSMLKEAPFSEVQNALNARDQNIVKLGRALLYSKILREHLIDVVKIRLDGTQASQDNNIINISNDIIKLERHILKLNTELANYKPKAAQQEKQTLPKRPLPSLTRYKAQQIANKLASVTTEPPTVVVRKKPNGKS